MRIADLAAFAVDWASGRLQGAQENPFLGEKYLKDRLPDLAAPSVHRSALLLEDLAESAVVSLVHGHPISQVLVVGATKRDNAGVLDGMRTAWAKDGGH